MQESIGLDDPVPGQKRSTGRPTKKTKAVTDRLFAAIERGMPYAMACELSGISEAVFYQWRQDSAFDTEVIRRTRESVFELLDTIKEARHQNWQAAAFLLERRWPRHYGRAEAQLNFEVAITNNNQTVNNTLIVSAEVGDQIQSRAGRADATIEKLFAARKAAQTNSGDGKNGDDIREVETSLVPGVIVRPAGMATEDWWRQFCRGSTDRLVERQTAQWVVQTVARETLGSSAGSISFEDETVRIGELLGVLERLTGTNGWQQLLKKSGLD